jgi:hypothetical protein
MGTLLARTLTREALRVSPARVQVLGRSNSWFIMERGGELSVPIKCNQQLYESVPESIRTVPNGPHAWIMWKDHGLIWITHL